MEKTVVLTGGSSGIGAATMRRLSERNCRLLNLDLKPGDASGITHVACDLAKADSINDAVAKLPETVDVLIHVAGAAPGQVSDDDVLAVNFLGLRHLTESLLPRITVGGRIIIVASSAGRDWPTNETNVKAMLDTNGFEAGQALSARDAERWRADAYKFSKQCAAAYTYRAVGAAKQRNITVNCINPGIVDTPLSPRFKELLGHARYDWITDKMGRPGVPDDIAPVIEFLALGECQWLNGVEITLDGGYYGGILGGSIRPDEMPD